MTGLTVKDRELALVSGRWGDSSQVLELAGDWYGRAGADRRLVTGQSLHPIAHYQALLHHEDDADDLLVGAAAITSQLPTRGSSLDPANWELTDSEADERLRAILDERLTTSSIVETTPEQRERAFDAIELLKQTLPVLGPDALSYVGRFVVTDDTERVGETMRDLPTVLIFGPTIFDDVKALAESFFHEALHSKTIIAERSANIVKEDHYERHEVMFIPWRQEKDGSTSKWSISRAFLAFYVYAHLSVLWASFWERDRGARDLDQLRRSCFRAAYLSSQLHSHPDATGLGPARYEILEWLDVLRLPAFDLTPRAVDLIAI